MSSPDEQALIQFVNTLPPTTNPYSAVARHLIQLLEPPPTSTVGRWLERVILLCFVVIFIQCCCVIYTRIKAKIFRGFGFDELGLLSIDVPSVCAVGYLIYSSLVITDSILDEILATDYRLEGGRIMLFGCKFIVILNCSWIFLWSCACLCASLKWKSSTQGRTFGKSIPNWVPWTMHFFLFFLIAWPIPLVFWEYGQARTGYNAIVKTVLTIVESFRERATTISPDTYNKVQLLLALIPARQVGIQLDVVARSVQLGIEVFLVDIVTLCLAYIPFLIFSLRALYLRDLSEKYYVNTLVGASVTELIMFRTMNENTHKEWNLVVLHAVIAYTATLAHVPIIIWQLTFTGESFLRDSRWMLGTRLGLHGPFSIIGMVSLYLLHRTSKEERSRSEERFVLPSTKLNSGKKKKEEEVIIERPVPNLSITPQTLSSPSYPLPKRTRLIELPRSIGYQEDIYKVVVNQDLESQSSFQIVNNNGARSRGDETLRTTTTTTTKDQNIIINNSSPQISGKHFSAIRKPVLPYTTTE